MRQGPRPVKWAGKRSLLVLKLLHVGEGECLVGIVWVENVISALVIGCLIALRGSEVANTL